MSKFKVPGKLKVSSKRLASIAAVGIRFPERLSAIEIQILAASVLAQAKVDTKDVLKTQAQAA
jgi:hypothetical protein